MPPKSVQLASLVFAGALASVTVGAQQPAKAAHTATPAQHTAQKAVASVKDVMLAITIPTSETVFKAASDAPKDAAGWEQTRMQAIALAESANLLLIDGRGPRGEQWVTFAVAQREAALKAVAAIDAKNADALSTASDALYETCDNCHNKYMKK
jgi:hypothetical protein